jgi:hypothetical protein
MASSFKKQNLGKLWRSTALTLGLVLGVTPALAGSDPSVDEAKGAINDVMNHIDPSGPRLSAADPLPKGHATMGGDYTGRGAKGRRFTYMMDLPDGGHLMGACALVRREGNRAAVLPLEIKAGHGEAGKTDVRIIEYYADYKPEEVRANERQLYRRELRMDASGKGRREMFLEVRDIGGRLVRVGASEGPAKPMSREDIRPIEPRPAMHESLVRLHNDASRLCRFVYDKTLVPAAQARP